jgi:Family of unknown function (DUF6390)
MMIEAVAPAVSRLEPVSGPLSFARFAVPPNVLGYCGGADSEALVGHLQVGLDGPELVALCQAFEGAWPYLQLIAGSAGLADPLDPRVVEAYWLGNRLLDGVPPASFTADLERRFRPRTPRREWPWLASKPADGARPHHSFHVLEVMPRIGMLRAGQIQAIVPAMEQCLIRPATVVTTKPMAWPGGQSLVVAIRPLLMRDGNLAFGPTVEQAVTGGPDVDVRPGDPVAVHWGWSCGRITPAQARALESVSADALQRANETI